MPFQIGSLFFILSGRLVSAGKLITLLALFAALFILKSSAQAQRPEGCPEWVQDSNRYWQIASTALKTAIPETLSEAGVQEADEVVADFSKEGVAHTLQAYKTAIAKIKQRQTTETDPAVRQDIEVILRRLDNDVKRIELERKYFLPYTDVSTAVFNGLRPLLDDQVAPERRKAALVRLRKYAGMESEFRPAADLCAERLREGMRHPELLGPDRRLIDSDMANSGILLEGLGKLFVKYKLTGYEEPLRRLKTQVNDYNHFVQTEVRPHCRKRFQLPQEYYQFNLESGGIDITSTQLADEAHAAFWRIQAEMQALAPQVALTHGWTYADYQSVIKALKKEQLVGDAVLPYYTARLHEVEDIIRHEHIVSLPIRPARIRLPTSAEVAREPGPHMTSPRIIGNTGEEGEFVLPAAIAQAQNGLPRCDDLTCEAASWTLIAHEARPGHELQFAVSAEKGTSAIRAIAAFNTVNVEGWAVYAESIIFPYMSPEGKLISLQCRLLRAARAFCDPELQTGMMTPDQVIRLLVQDVGLSERFAREEVDRYTFRNPGQAPAYFYGYSRFVALRTEIQKRQGRKFSARRFHDAILAQGLLPIDLLRKGVFAELGLPIDTASIP